ncbi:MAG: hypothetical protein LBS27_06390, partial [Bifidobacteriaceae bacterium]|nr:hypothetical protein [Bifidobacteriaceae bacterium]
RRICLGFDGSEQVLARGWGGPTHVSRVRRVGASAGAGVGRAASAAGKVVGWCARAGALGP